MIKRYLWSCVINVAAKFLRVLKIEFEVEERVKLNVDYTYIKSRVINCAAIKSKMAAISFPDSSSPNETKIMSYNYSDRWG